jgi:acyl transferase domain-containing protein/acyl carrier protein
LRSEDVARLIARLVAARVDLAPEQIDHDRPLESYGLDSAAAVTVAGELEQALGRPLHETLVYDFPTVRALSAHLSGAAPEPAAADRPRAASGPGQPIAIVGIGCRFPSAGNVDELWELLVEGRSAISSIPPDRRELSDDDGADRDPATTRGGWISQVDRFDCGFFGISPREANFMDPQQRLVLEVTSEALDDAGIARSALAGTPTATVVGASTTDYALLQLAAGLDVDAYMATGGSLSIIANRIAYSLDLHGPSYTVDTACSSSLVAIHLACQSIWSGESALALAGGVNLMLSSRPTAALRALGALSPDGVCRPFDAQANGYVRGEGAGMFVLKPLQQAARDRDRVYAAILGTAVNSNGASNGLTAPNGPAQEAVVSAACAAASVPPAQVGCVEAHGTGTRLGDPIEALALGRVLGRRRSIKQRCSLGSIKSNIGHLEAAAGVAGATKLALSLHRGQLLPSANFDQANPAIPFAKLPVAIQRQPADWPQPPGERFAGVSSFGYGGTNAHAVLCDHAAGLARLEDAA